MTDTGDRGVEADEPTLGMTIAHFRLVQRLGRGGMGVVFRADDLKLERQVALKFLLTGEGEDPERRARFMREARAAAGIVHPAVATVFEVGEDQGYCYIAMELIDGTTLRDHIAQGALSVDKVQGIARAMADGLHCAHRAGVIHRDLKPDNVMLTREGEVRILDFGLAKPMPGIEGGLDSSTPTQSATFVTQEGQLVGTPGYMAPEQIRGQAVTPRSDVFAFGVLLYEMLSGRPCFEGDTPFDVLMAIVRDDPRPLDELRADVPQTLQRTIESLLRKEPQERPASMGEVRALLDGADPTLAEGRDPPPRSAQPPARRSRPWLFAAAFVAVLSSAGLAALWWSPATKRTPTAAVEGSQRVLRVGLPTHQRTLPLYRYFYRSTAEAALHATFNTLLRWQDQGLRPGAVDRWETREQGQQLDLFLRPSETFHDNPCFEAGRGRRASLADLAASVELAARQSMRVSLPLRGVQAFASGQADHLDGVEILPDRVRLSFTGPCVFCLELLSEVFLVPTELESCQDPVRMTDLPGSGPYVLSEPDVRDRYRLRPAPADERAGFFMHNGGVELTAAEDIADTVASLVRDDLDVFVVHPRNVNALLADGSVSRPRLKPDLRHTSIQLLCRPRRDMHQLAFLVVPRRQGAPLNDPVLRRAISLALDRRAMAQYLGLRPESALLDARFVGSQDIGGVAQADVGTARQLVRTARAQKEIPPLRLIGVGRVAQLVVDALASIGLDVMSVPGDSGSDGRFVADLILSGWSGPVVDGADPSLFVAALLAREEPTYLDAATRALGRQLLVTRERSARAELISRLQERILNGHRLIPYGMVNFDAPSDCVIARKEVRGLTDPVSGRLRDWAPYLFAWRP